MGRFFSYERVSSSRQANDGKGLERQAGDAETWCAAKGVELDTELSLADEGRSAFHGDHLKGALGQFLSLAQEGALGNQPTLLVEAIDRLSRQEPLDGLQDVLLALVRADVTLISLEDGAEYSRATLREDGTKLVMLALKAQAAHEYSKRLSRRITATWDQAIAELEAGRLPRGEVFVPQWCELNSDRVRLIPEKADAVRRIFEMALLDGPVTIAGRLNQESYPTISGKPTWTRSAVKAVIDDPRTRGAVRLNWQRTLSAERRARRGERAEREMVFEDVLPAAITTEKFAAVHAAMAERHKPKQRLGKQTDFQMVSQGLTFCCCGARVGTTATSSGRKLGSRKWLRYAKCRHRCDHRDGCRGIGYRLERLNAHILSRLQAGLLQRLLAANTGKEAQIRAEQSAVTDLQGKQSLAEGQLANAERMFKDALKQGQLDPLFKEAVAEARADMESAAKALATAQQRLNALRRDIDTASFDQAISALFTAFAEGTDTAEQRMELNHCLRKADVRVTLDNQAKRVGIAVGDGEVDWQPMNEHIDREALRLVMVESKRFKVEVDDQILDALQRMAADQDVEILDVGAAFAEILRSRGKELADGPFLVDTVPQP
ncbi:recombinase family protein [Synechococcus sp. MIT S9503]|uniref:recombinase family protein n=1 Tax=Synechococcus sp. MIT S9503 TaxID=3082547 RepID=UPI0039A745F8